MNVEMAADFHCRTGENPIWHSGEKMVYWLDIPAGRLFRHEPGSAQSEEFDVGAPVGGATIQADGSLLLFMARGAVRTWRNGEMRTVIEEIPGELDSRFNDVIADPHGRVFCGTMPCGDRPGRLYRLDPDRSLRVALEDVLLSNGMGFTPDGTGLYFTDTRRLEISLFDYDRDSGEIRNRRVFAAVPRSDAEGHPDGLTVDSTGFVWSARWDGWGVVRYAPDGSEVERVDLPAKKVSSIGFGGEDFRDAYITTAGAQDRAANGPGAGALFRMRMPVPGVPEFRSRIGL